MRGDQRGSRQAQADGAQPPERRILAAPRNPPGVAVIDALDARVRRRFGLDGLPPYSLRVRSNGVPGPFGGMAFFRLGRISVNDLITYAGLTAESTVLDIGCGAGRDALALSDTFPALRYTGLDVDQPSIDGCLANPRLSAAGYTFIRADVSTDLYNPNGAIQADSYRLPFPDDEFDLVFGFHAPCQ